MSENKQGNTLVEFEALEQDTDESKSSKFADFQKHLKDNLPEEKYAEAMKILGVPETDLTNKELLEAIKSLVGDGEEEGATEMADYKEFIKECMAGGKTLQECGEEWKK